MRRSYSLTVVSSAKISGARSTKRRFQSPTEFGCTPYAFATCPGVLSPASTSSTTCAFSFGVYLRLAAMTTSFRSARSTLRSTLPEVKLHQRGMSRIRGSYPGFDIRFDGSDETCWMTLQQTASG